MQKFILIDHSLKDLGGHHYPYAASVLQAAVRAGFAPVLACHRAFHDDAAFDGQWPVYAAFRHPSYSRYTFDTQSPHGSRVAAAKVHWMGRLRHRWAMYQRQRLARHFAEDLARLFSRLTAQAGDIIFLATASELDLSGLMQFLRSNPPASRWHWHLQLHFGIFRSRPPQYPNAREAESAMRAAFAAALDGAATPNIHFYCTTEPLSVQYRRLGLTQFETLPYPIHSLFRAPKSARDKKRPLRIACLGHARREKGQGQLPQLLQQLWPEYFGQQLAQLVVQSPKPPLRRELLDSLKKMGGSNTLPVDFAAGGLGLDDYAGLLRSCDVGLLLYDGERYYDRCSGVLLELLGSAIPVVVPAGSWLSEQIASVEQQYLRELQAELAAAGRVQPMEWSGTTVRLNASATHATTLTVPAGSNAILLRCRWQEPLASGSYLRAAVQTQAKALYARVASVTAGGELRLLLPLPAGANTAELRLNNAFCGDELLLEDCEVFAVSGVCPPLGALGLSIDNPTLVAATLRDILQHFAHYERWAQRFAPDFLRHFSAEHVVARLQANSGEPE